ncbi:polysaccharide deacetylase [Keratinibaculum paraultunense]|uniref:Polysaccharide deacetylase n=1 Tax=Keratinibaculum paraultunense TaxID=1278232 RepID=A0A4R3L168_9FIRM|nr:polysaccharide deacetylase family protein [Keratinibaculum paraultunense]QQY79933.1 polysaccharide deacetylase family protein [Keratinibaculum paraultunense]TCS91748.1 polysaccharide deacetylase [Keratinibaculum paraultunense]
MKKLKIIFLITIILLGQTIGIAYAENNIENLEEKYQLLHEENKRLRNEILKLKNQISEKKAEKIPVLLYHHILKQEDIDKYNWSENNSVLSLETFEEQMNYLYENGFYTATLDELQSFLNGEITFPEKTVVITFDDGYLSNALYAYPIMKKYNFRGTIFMLGYRVDDIQASFNPSSTQSLSIHEAYKYEDVFDYESHTYKLHDVDKNGNKLLLASDKKTIINDLTMSKNLLNAKYFSYPYGVYDENTIKYLKDTGYEMAFTIKPGYVTKDLNKYELPRFSISPQVPFSRFKRIVNGIYE